MVRFFALFALIFTAGCLPKPQVPDMSFQLQQAGLTKKEVEAGPFLLTIFGRMTAPKKEIHVYIEGDGHAYVTKTMPSPNPTPTRPVALELALADPAPNVIYIARPCQYTEKQKNISCTDNKWWTTHRFDTVTVAALDNALDKVKDNPKQPIELIGFSGGATHALLLAARRHDVLSVRTVAGNISPKLVNRYHGVSALPSALNPMDFSEILMHIPQRHFVGGKDRIILPELVAAYTANMRHEECIRAETVPDFTHTDLRWQNIWPSLLKKPPFCVVHQ